ncbi:MAG: pantoate--beta-alanine ligase [Planctomycetaceae bacterium]|nr:pantoate--beta-alanine ligase [Planctomycetaceae bacterium]
MIATDNLEELRRLVAEARRTGRRIGCVPTMGALHAGHLSLMRDARGQCDVVVTTIFVNPTQFAPDEDFQKYPRTLPDDLEQCREVGVDLVFHPPVETMYPPRDATYVDLDGPALPLEGVSRPGHFRGVATVVVKLLMAVGPDVAFFGQKDYQQQLVIRRFCRDLLIPVEIQTCPIIREPDGLAMSSRNAYLSPDERTSALALSQALDIAGVGLTAGNRDLAAVREAMHAHLNSTPGVEIEYAVLADPETLAELKQPQAEIVALIAARVGQTRLIDNAIFTV